MLLVLELSRRRERTRGVEASDSKANEVNRRPEQLKGKTGQPRARKDKFPQPVAVTTTAMLATSDPVPGWLQNPWRVGFGTGAKADPRTSFSSPPASIVVVVASRYQNLGPRQIGCREKVTQIGFR